MSNRTYIIKLSTKLKLSDMMRRLEPIGEVVSFREASEHETTVPGPNGVAAPAVGQVKSYVRTLTDAQRAAMSEARRQSANEAIRKRREWVYPELSRILRANQYAPIGTIVKLLNQTDVRPLRDGSWRDANIGPYIEYALARMTSPNDTATEQTSIENTPAAS
jgi:hypothetical protein